MEKKNRLPSVCSIHLYHTRSNCWMITSHRTCSVSGAVICTISRSLDFRNAAYFHRQYDELLEQGFRYFILDFSDTDVFDSSGLGSVFGLQKRLLPEGGRLLFASPSRSVATVLRLIRSERMFRTYPSVEAALADLPAVPQEAELVPAPACIPEIQPEETAPADTHETISEPFHSETPAISAEPAPPEHAPAVHAAVEEALVAMNVEIAPPPVPEQETVVAREASTTASPITEPAAEGNSPGTEAEQDIMVPGGPGGDGSIPEPALSVLSPTPVAEQLPADAAPDRTAFQNLLDKLRSYGLIQSYTLEPGRVRLYLFEDGQPLDMDHASAEAFCLDLKRSLPGF